MKVNEEVKEPSCIPTLTTAVCAALVPEVNLNTMDVSDTQMVAGLALDRQEVLGVVPCVPKKLPKMVAETQPVAGEFVGRSDET